MLIPLIPFAACPRDREADRRAAVEGPWWLAPLAAPRAVDIGETQLLDADADALVEMVRERPTHVLRCRDAGLAIRLLDEGAVSVVVSPEFAAVLPEDIPPGRVGLLVDDADAVATTPRAATIWTTDRSRVVDEPLRCIVFSDVSSFDPAASRGEVVALRAAHRSPADFEARAFCAAIGLGGDTPIWTVICDGVGAALAWGWSGADSVRRSMIERSAYVAPDRDGAPVSIAGALVAVEADDRGQALRFIVDSARIDAAWPNRWPGREGFSALFARLRERVQDAPIGSYTRSLLDSPDMLRGKLLEEAAELAAASSAADVRGEAADVLYFAWVALARAGVSPGEVETELARRALRLNRRPGDLKPQGRPKT
ncbi:MAG: phosphoribosyl-ATP diphosphatase [Deltaproteobacteria bacterium]|nr:phosphoribosyl-ATP diphosphatase [Deltaproteobacteria bacterium]